MGETLNWFSLGGVPTQSAIRKGWGEYTCDRKGCSSQIGGEDWEGTPNSVNRTCPQHGGSLGSDSWQVFGGWSVMSGWADIAAGPAVLSG